jgi:hypothetical protein
MVSISEQASDILLVLLLRGFVLRMDKRDGSYEQRRLGANLIRCLDG